LKITIKAAEDNDKAEHEPTLSLVISWPERWGGGGGRGNDGGT
jgi:hypothetical protein